MLEALCSNVVLAGGLWRIKGMQTYFKNALKENFDKYLALEVLTEKNISSKSDIWSLGCIYYELLHGHCII